MQACLHISECSLSFAKIRHVMLTAKQKRLFLLFGDKGNTFAKGWKQD